MADEPIALTAMAHGSGCGCKLSPGVLSQALASKPITVFGDGTQSRCFGFVGDVVGAIAALVTREEAYGQVFNIGSQEEISIMGLAQLVKERLKSKSEIVLIPYDQAYEAGFEDMPRRVPDIDKIRALVGFEPRTRIPEIIDLVAEHYRVTV